MNVCAGCGTRAPDPRLPCGACGAVGVVTAPEPSGRLYFVRVRAQFQCRGCGRLAPLDDLDVDGLVRCALCGLTQAFDPTAWTEALAFSHAVGDLAAGDGLHPSPRWAIGKQNRYRDLGVARSTAVLTLDGTVRQDGLSVQRSLRLDAGPGHPLCDACHAPLEITLAGSGEATTRCPQCGTTGHYLVPANVLATCRGLRAVLADGHHANQREARTSDAGGVVGLSCPGCGAPLEVEGHARTVACAFCHLVCRIPAEAPMGAADAPPTPFWLLFSGPSPERAALEAGGSPAGADGAARGGGARKIGAVTPAKVGGLGFWIGMIPPLVVGGGMTVVTGIVLFVLMRLSGG